MIDVMKERLYTLNYARRWFPRRRRGQRPSLQTMYRYTSNGFHGIVMDSAQVAGTRCTSKEAVVRFIERISGLTPQPETVSAPCRQKAVRQIDMALELVGFDRRPSGPRATSGHVKENLGGVSIPGQAAGAVDLTAETCESNKGESR